MGPTLTNCFRLEQLDTKEFGKMMKKNSNSRGRNSPPKEAKNWIIEGEKKRITRKE